MSVPIFKPRTEPDLLKWSANFVQNLSPAPLAFGLSVPQLAHYQSLHDEFAAAYMVARNPNTNSKAAIIAKNQAKRQLLYAAGGARDLVRIVQAFPGTTNDMRGVLALRPIDASPTRVGRPRRSPQLTILHSQGRMIKVRLRDQERSTRRGKPDGVIGATILYHVGEHPPVSPSAWIFAKNTSRTVFNVRTPIDVAAGAKMWLTAMWFNARMQMSPAATPQCTCVSDGLALAA